MAIREGWWRCPACQAENRGRDQDCQACSRARDANVAFYKKQAAPEVKDAAVLRRAAAGGDLICPYCRATTPGDKRECTTCGAPLSDAERRAAAAAPAGAAPPPPPPRPAARSKGTAVKVLAGCGGLLMMCCVFSMVLSLWTDDIPVTVQRASWTRTIGVERQNTVVRTGWEGELPTGARPVSSQQKIRRHERVQVDTEVYYDTVTEQVQVGTRRVKVGTKDLGNGFFEDVYKEEPVFETRTRQVQKTRPIYREQPVYGTEITYEIEEWQQVRELTAFGTDVDVRWPTVDVGPGEREGKREEKFEVILVDDEGETYEVEDLTMDRFIQYAPGSRHVAVVGKLGDLRETRPAD